MTDRPPQTYIVKYLREQAAMAHNAAESLTIACERIEQLEEQLDKALKK